MKVTRQMVEAVKADACFSCGAHSFEDCPRGRDHPCGREHEGGTRAGIVHEEEKVVAYRWRYTMPPTPWTLVKRRPMWAINYKYPDVECQELVVKSPEE